MIQGKVWLKGRKNARTVLPLWQRDHNAIKNNILDN